MSSKTLSDEIDIFVFKLTVSSRYNRNTSTYENWGMSSSLVNQAWEVSPENVTVSYTTGSDTESFNIDHRP